MASLSVAVPTSSTLVYTMDKDVSFRDSKLVFKNIWANPVTLSNESPVVFNAGLPLAVWEGFVFDLTNKGDSYQSWYAIADGGASSLSILSF
jgi:hypothetical protein